MNNKTQSTLWNIITIAGISIFALHSIVFVLYGKANADEGWYLYASKLVYLGQLPYKDFAFTQTPLLPYIYGIPQNILTQSLYLGRITSVAFSFVAFLLSIQIARNDGHDTSGAITALLGATFTYGIYFQSITKTYALTTFFFILAFYIFSLEHKKGTISIWAAVVVLLAVFTRLSTLFFAIPFIIYILLRTDLKNRIVIIVVYIAAGLLFLALAIQNMDATIWGLVTHHTSKWDDTTFIQRIITIFKSVVPWIIRELPSYALLVGTLVVLGFNQFRSHLQQNLAIRIATIALCLFTIPNLMGGGFQPDNFVPLIFTSLPILGIVIVGIYRHQGMFSKIFLSIALLISIAIGWYQGWRDFIDTSGGYAPIEEIDEISTIIEENSDLQDRILVLEALWLAIEAEREVMPNMTMAQFSFYDTDTATAHQLHVVNSKIILDYIRNGEPKIIVLTESDDDLLAGAADYDDILHALDEKYRKLYKGKDFGQNKGKIQVYIRR